MPQPLKELLHVQSMLRGNATEYERLVPALFADASEMARRLRALDKRHEQIELDQGGKPYTYCACDARKPCPDRCILDGEE